MIRKDNMGTSIMFLFASIGCIISLFNFLNPSSPIHYTAGAELVVLTTFSLAVLSFILFFLRTKHARWERMSFCILIIGLLLGTLFAVWLLESWILFIVLLLVLAGWFMQIFTQGRKK